MLLSHWKRLKTDLILDRINAISALAIKIAVVSTILILALIMTVGMGLSWYKSEVYIVNLGNPRIVSVAHTVVDEWQDSAIAIKEKFQEAYPRPSPSGWKRLSPGNWVDPKPELPDSLVKIYEMASIIAGNPTVFAPSDGFNHIPPLTTDEALKNFETAMSQQRSLITKGTLVFNADLRTIIVIVAVVPITYLLLVLPAKGLSRRANRLRSSYFSMHMEIINLIMRLQPILLIVVLISPLMASWMFKPWFMGLVYGAIVPAVMLKRFYRQSVSMNPLKSSLYALRGDA